MGRVVQDVTVSDDVDAELRSAASQINDTIQNLDSGGLNVEGGTPTAASLNKLADNPILLDPARDNFVLLLTDGLPNCNENQNPATCKCLESADPNKPCQLPFNCLDDTTTVQAIANLNSRGIRTIVVGFGLNTNDSLARDTLNAMAQAGSFPRKCSAGQQCDAFYQAANAADLATALIEIQNSLQNQKPCEFPLSASPTDRNAFPDGLRGRAAGR